MKSLSSIWFFLVTATLTFLSYFATGDGFGFCNESKYRECVGLVNNVSEPILWALLSVSVVSFFLTAFRQEIFKTWLKFVSVGLPVMLIILLITYNNVPRMGGWVDWGSDEEIASVLLPVLFFLISLIIISVKSYRLRKARTV